MQKINLFHAKASIESQNLELVPHCCSQQCLGESRKLAAAAKVAKLLHEKSFVIGRGQRGEFGFLTAAKATNITGKFGGRPRPKKIGRGRPLPRLP